MGFRSERDVARLALPLGKVDAYFFDETCPGLSVRIQGAARRWVVHYQLPDRRRRKIVLGPVSGLSLKDARREAARVVSDARQGSDELAERERKRAKAAESFGQLAERYLAGYAAKKQRPRTLAETTRALRQHFASLHPLPLEDVTRRVVADHLLRLAESSGPIAASRARAALSHCFAWALQAGLTDNNPVIGTPRPGAEVKRDRVLSSAELRQIWAACGDDAYGRIVRLLLLTGQ